MGIQSGIAKNQQRRICSLARTKPTSRLSSVNSTATPASTLPTVREMSILL